MLQPTIQNINNELSKRFFEKFGANKIWVKPSKDNVETILDMHSFFQSSLNSSLKQLLLSLLDELPKVEKAHTYSSENADVYRAFDGGQEDYKKRVTTIINKRIEELN